MNQRINLNCRFCFIYVKNRDNIEYNIIDNEKFHHEIIRMKKHINKKNKIQKTTYDRKIKLNSKKSFLFSFSFVFNIILIRLNDSIHSKHDDIIKFFHNILMTTILTFQIQKNYFDTIRIFVYFFNWNKFQFFYHYLNNYFLQKHVRWFIIIFALFRCWLIDVHVQSKFFSKIKRMFSNSFSNFRFIFIIDVIVFFFVVIAKSNVSLMTNQISNENKTIL